MTYNKLTSQYLGLKDAFDYVPIDVMWTIKRADLKRTVDTWTASRGSVGDFAELGSQFPGCPRAIRRLAVLGSPNPNVAFGSKN
jgi:hypothetical protein